MTNEQNSMFHVEQFKRTPSVEVHMESDPFLETGLSVDDQVRQINPDVNPNGHSRADVRQFSQIFTPDMNRLDRFSAARNFQQNSPDVAERVVERYKQLSKTSK